MNKTLLKNFAIDARIRLLQMIQDKAALVGVTKDKIESPVSKSGDYEIYKTPAGTENTITGREIKQRENLVKKIKSAGFDNVMEQAAYTWFNRIIAIRYMEVNDYLPTHTRVLSSATEGKKEPDIVTESPNGVELNFTDSEKQKIVELKSKNKTDDLFALLFIKQCNELNKILPKLFENTNTSDLDFTELLFGLSYTRTDGLLSRLLEIDESDFKDQVQIIGWMYQYYNTELKDDTFAKLKKNVKITKERIPAATQLFTPDWIVRYMVENSLGRLYAQSQKTMDEKTVADSMGWKYYLPQAEQTEEVQKKLDEIKTDFNLETVKILDPCMGSGHILVYAFDVLVKIYQNAGYNERDAAKLILENNIYGLDIDDRAAQLAYFALMMKGRQYDRRFFDRGVSPKVYAIQESNGIDRELLKRNLNVEKSVIEALETTLNTFNDAKEYGSILNVEKIGYDGIIEGLENWKKNKENDLESVIVEECIDDQLMPLIAQAKVMSDKFDVVVTNPPYMGSTGMGNRLSSYVKIHFPDSKADMFSIFIDKASQYVKQNGFYSMIVQPSILFLSSFEKLRNRLISNQMIMSSLHMGRGIFGIDFGSAAFVLRNTYIPDYIGGFFKLHKRTFQYIAENDIAELYLKSKNNTNYKYNFAMYKNTEQVEIEEVDDDNTAGIPQQIFYNLPQDCFLKIPGVPIACDVSNTLRNTFESQKLSDYAYSFQGMITGDNNYYLRLWHELNKEKVFFNLNNSEANNYNNIWVPYNKGGPFRKWYGNNEYLLRWIDNGKKLTRARTENREYYFVPGVTWSFISSGTFSCRYFDKGFLWDVAGSSIFATKELSIKYICGLMNSSYSNKILNILNPTINYQVENVINIPVRGSKLMANEVENIVSELINFSKTDWDSFETSWDFTKHPLLPINNDYKDAAANSLLISDCYSKWETECSERFAKLKSNEEELNKIFIEIYGLQDELTPEVLDKDVTVRLADKTRDVKSFISYAVGCMFGRYSLSKEGLAYAGGNMDMNNYKYFVPDADNVIPVTDEAYFNDDIVTRFVEFVRQVYGESTLDKNLAFIAESLGNKGDTPKEVIRSYFLNDFYKDHCKIYQKRPIYWMFDSGKENGFKALIYMHRYDNQTLARVRTDYLHKLQTMYEAALVQCKQIIENPVSSAHDKSNNIKRQTKITKQLAETRIYDQALGHIASQYIDIDLDDGVNVNYEKFQGVEVAREGQKALKVDLLGKRG